MHKTWLIIKREFTTRVRKRSFIIMTILGPLFSAGIFILPAYLATLPDNDRTVTVLDEARLMSYDQGRDNIHFRYLPPDQFNLKTAKALFEANSDYAFLYIPMNHDGDPDFIGRNVMLYSKGDVSLSVENFIEAKLEKYIQKEKLRAQGVDPEILARTRSNVHIHTINIKEGKEVASLGPVKMGIGYVAAFLIYIFVFIYGSQVMRGVIEEKTNRIVEVMISSVKPFQLMSGKIFGLAAVALLQFLIWLVFGALFYVIAIYFVLGDKLSAAQVAQQNPMLQNHDMAFSFMHILNSINFGYIIGCFLFFFLFGYLLYAAMFAAIGSAVDKESDTQQFIFPVSIPLIAGIIVLLRALDNPDGQLAFWFSMVPLTSPIVMMARVPFDIPVWQLILSMTILVLTFIFMTWAAGRIYRTGILLYGKKPSLKEVFKWIRYSSR